jgi:hypothetical protein
MMKKLLILSVSLLLAIQLVPGAQAASEDEQWKKPTVNAIPYHDVVFEEGIAPLDIFPHLFAESKVGRYICKSTSDGECAKADQYVYTAIFPTCANDSSVDCIESLSAILPDGKIEAGSFKRYAVPNHVNKFSPDASLEIPATESPGMWEFPTLTHVGGKSFLLDIGVNGLKCITTQCGGEEKTFFGYLVPVSVLPNGGLTDYEQCRQLPVDAQGRTNTSCSTGPQTSGDQLCFISLEENRDCLMRRPMPEGTRFKVVTRLSVEPSAWLHGRMTDPNIEIKKSAGAGTSVTVEAGATKVPVLYQGGLWPNLSSEIQKFWSDCRKMGQSCGTVGASDEKGMNYEAANAVSKWSSQMLNYGSFAIKSLNTIAKAVGDKANANPSTWSFHTLTKKEMGSASSCFKKSAGVKGIVTTNATTYSEGPPAFSDGFLNYQVASPHYAPDGVTELKGNYNLVIRSDVARCLYGFSTAPVSATISVVSSTGENQIATTIVNERNGWLQLSANGFTYSSPLVKVKLSQAGSKVAKSSTITCVKGKTSKKVTATNPKCPTGYKKK